MTSLLNRLSLCLCVLQIIVTAIKGEFVDLPPKNSLQSLAEEETVLPCRYQPSNGNVVVQVTWFKKNRDATKDQIITAHRENGQTGFGLWAQRVRFKSSEPTVDSTLVIMSTGLSDEGMYICHISTFPSGNFDNEMSLIVWTIPISSLDPVVVVEGQAYRQVASCRSIGHPPPHLSWDTELNGQSINRSLDNGAVSTYFSLHPLRSMNGKKLDCLVWHPAFPGPRRLKNNLVVHFPPDAEVSGYNGDWFVGLENAVLTCASGGNPKPHSFTWSRLGGHLPKDAIADPNGSLVFGRPLNSSDEGIYQCEAVNEVGKAKAEVEIRLTDTQREQTQVNSMMMIMLGGAAGGLLLLMLTIIITLTCYHKRKNKRLKQELNDKREEISTLSRQASFRRVNSYSTDARGATEENIPLKVEGTLRTSLSSLGPEQPHCRDSRSTISGGRGGGGAYDSLGRPVLYNNSRRGRDRFLDREEDHRLRVETYVRNSNMSLQESRFHPPLMPSPFPPLHSTEILRHLNGSALIPVNGGSRQGSITKNYLPPPMSSSYPPLPDDEDEVDEGLGGPASQEHPDDQVSEASCSNVSTATSTQSSKLRIAMPILESPHNTMIHKAQIV
ncbi:nectin-4 [Melanotaenia boesemani]|uniref:nectin-4 n=1 Tax=Melanotaenia boesemani TaxID=1250792 RepID=UPI001C04BE73|nr:nectin-4 [Melanotaenia boesemani]